MPRAKPQKFHPAAKQRYIAWLRDPALHIIGGPGSRGTRPPGDHLYIIPFNIALPPLLYAKSSSTATAYTTLEPAITGHVLNALPQGEFGRRLKDFKAARLVRKTGVSAGSTATSHITGQTYLKRGGTSKSIPFGKSTAGANETEEDVYATAVNHFSGGGTLPVGEQITLVKEIFTTRS